MALIPSTIRRLYADRLNQIDQFRKNPLEIQQKVLSDIRLVMAYNRKMCLKLLRILLNSIVPYHYLC